MTVNTTAIRQLLNATFDDEALKIFCFDYFRPVYDKFASDTDRQRKIQLLIEYCEKLDQFDRLLTLLEEFNPKQYDKFISSIRGLPVTPKVDIQQLQQARQRKKEGDLRERVAEFLARERAYSTVKKEFNEGRMDSGRFSKWETTHFTECNKLLLDIWSVLTKKLAGFLAGEQAYQMAKAEFDKGRMDSGQFSKIEIVLFTEQNEFLLDIRSILAGEEYTEVRQLLDMFRVGQQEKTIQAELQAVAQRRGLSEIEIVQRLGNPGSDISGQMAHFILSIWEASL